MEDLALSIKNKKTVRDRKIARIYLVLFFLFVGIHKLDQIQLFYTGISLKSFTIITPLFIPPIFLVLAFFKYKSIHIKTKSTSPYSQFTVVLTLFTSLIFFLAIYGTLIGNPTLYIFTEIWIYLIVVFCILLGRYNAVWEDIYKPLIILFWIFFIPVYFGTFIPRLHLIANGGAEYLIDRYGFLTGTGTLAYEMYPILDFFPIIFILSIIRKKVDIWKILGVCTILGYLGLQIFFQKRAPSVRALSYIFIVFFTLQLIRPSLIKLLRIAIPAAIGMFLLLSVVSIDGLLGRLSQSGEDKSRQTEVGIMLGQFNPVEWIIGRGFGGYFVLDNRFGKGVGAYEVRPGVLGKVNLHIGFFYPILKGGLLFLFLTLAFSLPMLYRWMDKRWLKNEYNFTAFNVLTVIFLFQFIEGPFSSGATFLGVLYGFCWGKIATSLEQFVINDSKNLSHLEIGK